MPGGADITPADLEALGLYDPAAEDLESLLEAQVEALLNEE